MNKQYKYSCPSLPHSQCVPFTSLAAHMLQAASPWCVPAGTCGMLAGWIGHVQDLGLPWGHITGQPEAVTVAKHEVEACVKDQGSSHLGRWFWPVLCWLHGVHPSKAMARSSRGCGHCCRLSWHSQTERLIWQRRHVKFASSRNLSHKEGMKTASPKAVELSLQQVKPFLSVFNKKTN